MSRFHAIILHGTGGSPSGNWFPWLAEQLRSIDVVVSVPHFPPPEQQSLESWDKAFSEQVSLVDENSILVGHSMGATFALRLLERTSAPVYRTYLASPFADKLGHEEFDPLIATFIAGGFDWPTIRHASRGFRVYAGSDDPYVPFALMDDVAAKLDTPLSIIPGGKHLNAEAGFTQFEQLWDDIRESLTAR